MHMKYLRIENDKGYFLKEFEKSSGEWTPVDQITKENLLALLNKAISTDFDMDEFKEENLANKTHQIIYKNIFEKFTDLLSKKQDLRMKV